MLPIGASFTISPAPSFLQYRKDMPKAQGKDTATDDSHPNPPKTTVQYDKPRRNQEKQWQFDRK